MKLTKIMAMFFAATTIFATACSEEDKNNDGIDSGSSSLPGNVIVWPKDTTVTLTDHFLVDEGQVLVVEEGATVIAANTEVKPEIVVLGSMYCLGTEENPVTFTVEASSKGNRFSRNWGGIILSLIHI